MSVSVSGGPGSYLGTRHPGGHRSSRRGHGPALGPSRVNAQVAGAAGRPPRPPASRSGDRRPRSCPRPDRRRAGGLPSCPPANREGAEDRPILPPRARRDGPACDPLRLAEQIPRLRPRRRWRGDHRDVGGLHGDRAVDQLKIHSRLDGGGEKLLLAHRPSPFVKPRISGCVKPRPRRPRGCAARHGLAAEMTQAVSPLSMQRQALSTEAPPKALTSSRQISLTITAWGRVARVRKRSLGPNAGRSVRDGRGPLVWLPTRGDCPNAGRFQQSAVPEQAVASGLSEKVLSWAVGVVRPVRLVLGRRRADFFCPVGC